MAKKKTSFEDGMTRLGEIVGHLEKGDIPLEDALTLFEEGATLVKLCSGYLEKAEQKVSLLKNNFLTEPNSEPSEDEYDINQ